MLLLIVDQNWSVVSQEGYSSLLDIGRYEMIDRSSIDHDTKNVYNSSVKKELI